MIFIYEFIQNQTYQLMWDDRCTNDLNMVCELKLKREMELDFNKLILIKYEM